MTVQEELDLGEDEPGTMTETDITVALLARYGQVHGNGRRYAVASQVRSHAGFDARRTADFVAMDLWPSMGLTLHGHEIKVSRGDWLRELKDPSKAAEFIPWMNCWWVVASSERIVRPGELPDDWGLMAMRGGLLATVKKAPRRDALPMPPTRLAALLRAVTQTAEGQQRREHERLYHCHRKTNCGTERVPCCCPDAVARDQDTSGFSPAKTLVMCNCTQVPELGPCEHQQNQERSDEEGTAG